MSYRSSNTRSCERQLQGSLKKIEEWCTENGFKFSSSKTVCLHFHKKRGTLPDPDLFLYGKKIRVVRETKFLGVTFDQKLSFIPHLKTLKTKCMKALDIIKVVANQEWGADKTVLLNLYRSFNTFKIRLRLYCLWVCSTIVLENAEHRTPSRSSVGSWCFPNLSSRKPLCWSWRVTFGTKKNKALSSIYYQIEINSFESSLQLCF